MTESSSFYILVVSDLSGEYGITSAFEIAEARFSNRKWPIGDTTRLRNHVKEDDQLLFYLAGRKEHSHSIIGSAIAASTVMEGKYVEPDDWLTPAWNHFLPLTDISLFPNPIPVIELIKGLSFIRNKLHWGSYFQGGIVKITADDFGMIISNS